MARLTTSVMLKHYVKQRDEEYRQASNRMFFRLVESLPPKVATRLGYAADPEQIRLRSQLKEAEQAKDWERVAELAKRLGQNGR